jgi:predicted CxxxxCH...CXXCH cytochrome family protein
MKRPLRAALGLTFLLLVQPFDVGALNGIHAVGNNCATCHVSTLVPTSSGFNSNCLSCHSTGNAAAGKPFAASDQSNTSHKWSGTDYVPAKGAQPPQSRALTQVQTYTGSHVDGSSADDNSMACVRCHNPHSAAANSSHYLRIANNRNQLCLDCHRSRNVRSSDKGSHPVLVAYSSAVKLNPDGFNSPPQIVGASDLGSKLDVPGTGMLLCSTCHGTHNVVKAANDTTSGNGGGNLLRTNPRGASVVAGVADNPNICTNCHKGKTAHNAGNQNVQCNDCHGAHVEYDALDPNGPVNVKLIRRTVPDSAISSQNPGTGRIFFRYTSAIKKEYVNTDGTGSGICQGCHTAPATGNHAGVQATACKNCHTHSSTKGSFSPSCSSCHGYPPAIIAHSGAAHPNTSNCSLCHNTDPSVHRNGVVDVGSTCDGCHGYPPSYANGSPKANSHSATGHQVVCNTCHAGTTSTGTTITNTTLHLNGIYNLQPGAGASFTYTYSATGGTCSSISCHGNTGATWGSTAECTTCHGYPPPNEAGGYTGVNEASSPHIKHAGKGINYSFACSECHKGNSHGNGSFQDVFIDKNGITAGSSATYTAATRTCSALYCHSNGTSVASGLAVTSSIVWDSNTLTCVGCHGNPPAYVNNSPKANSHGSHNFSCGICHAGTTADGISISNSSLHVNKKYDVSPGAGVSFTYVFSESGGTCSNISCHKNGTAVWGSTLTCGSCHIESPGGD